MTYNRINLTFVSGVTAGVNKVCLGWQLGEFDKVSSSAQSDTEKTRGRRVGVSMMLDVGVLVGIDSSDDWILEASTLVMS